MVVSKIKKLKRRISELEARLEALEYGQFQNYESSQMIVDFDPQGEWRAFTTDYASPGDWGDEDDYDWMKGINGYL